MLSELSAHPPGPLRRACAAHPTVVDVLLVLVFAGWALLTGVGADSMYGLGEDLGGRQVAQMQVLSLVLTVLGAVALLQRRRWPVAVAAVTGALGVLALAGTGALSGFEVGLALALYTVAATRRPALTWAVAAASVLALLAAGRVLPRALLVNALVLGADPVQAGGLAAITRRAREDVLLSAVWAQTAVPVLVLALLAIAVGTSVRDRRLHLAQVVQAAQALAHEQEQRARLARVSERARIAREMHDVVAHSVSVMIALGDGAAAALERSPDSSRAALDDLVATGRSALEDLRRILGLLHGEHNDRSDDGGDGGDDEGGGGTAPPTGPAPGSLDLTALVERFRRAGLPVRACVPADDDLPALQAGLGLTVYRIVQESLTNTLRHAPGTTDVQVRVQPAGGDVEVVITDAGSGTGAAPGPGPGSQRGLVGLRERAAAFGGTLQAGPDGPGWRVRALLPRDGVPV